MDGLRYGLKCLRTSCEAGCTRPDRQELPLPRQSRLDHTASSTSLILLSSNTEGSPLVKDLTNI